MAVKKSYGVGSPLVDVFPSPILAQRAPGVSDRAEIGQIWVNQTTQTIYQLAGIAAGSYTWTTAPAAGATTLASLEIDTGNLTLTGTGNIISDAGNLTLTAGKIELPNAAVTSNIAGDLTVQGTITATGVLDLTSATNITIDATGTAGISLDAVGTSNFSVSGASNDLILESALGKVEINATEDAAGTIALTALGGTNTTMTLLNTPGTATKAIDLQATAGGIGLTTVAAGKDITVLATDGSIKLTANENAAGSIALAAPLGVLSTITAINTQGTNAKAIGLQSTVGGIGLTSGLAAADSINLNTAATGGIDINAGSAGMTLDTTGALSLDSAAASNFTVTGAFDLSLVSTAGSVIVNGEEAAADAVRILSAAGGLDTNVALQMNLDSSQAAATAVRIIASAVTGGMDIDSGTGGMTLDTTGALSLGAAAASDFTVTGAGIDLTLESAAGSIKVNATEDAAGAIALTAIGGTTTTMTLLNTPGTNAKAIDLQATAGGIGLTTIAAGKDITVLSTAGSITLNSGEASQDAILFTSAAASGVQLYNGVQSAQILVGTGSPDIALLTAKKGSIYMRIDGSSTSTRMYINTDGATAWTNVTTAA